MAAIITSKFRNHNADQFYESFSEAAATKYYLFIGRPQSFSSGAGGGTDTAPPTPKDSTEKELSYFRDMVALKNIGTADTSYVIPRRNWTTGTTYDQYQHNYDSNNTSTSGASNLYDATFYVMTSDYKVYKCMWNDGGTASTIEPTGTLTSEVTTADGYVWKYMYSMTTSQVQNFLSTDFMPVSTDSTVSSAAVDGELSKIAVTTAGAGYNNATYTSVNVYGDGSNGVVTVVVAGGAVSTVTVTSTNETGYTFANINIDSISGIGTPSISAVASIFITPKGGHGYDAVTELGGFYVMMSTTITGAEGSGDFVIDNDFRRVGLIRDPYNYGTTTVSTSATLSAVKSVTFAASPTPGTFVVDEIITGGTSGAKGEVVAWDSTNRILKYIQTEWGGIDSDKNLTAFAGTEVVTGSTSTNTGTMSAVNNPEVAYNSGEIMYVENRAPITRASDQTEIIRLVVEF